MIDRIIVFIFGVMLIVFFTWFFFGEKKTGTAKILKSGMQEMDILVKGGYNPPLIQQ